MNTNIVASENLKPKLQSIIQDMQSGLLEREFQVKLILLGALSGE